MSTPTFAPASGSDRSDNRFGDQFDSELDNDFGGGFRRDSWTVPMTPSSMSAAPLPPSPRVTPSPARSPRRTGSDTRPMTAALGDSAYSAGVYSAGAYSAGAYSAGAYSAGIDQVRYWVGAALTAAVTAMVGIIGLVVAHGIVHVPVLVRSGGELTPIHSALYGLILVGLTLGAAALFDAMLHVAPHPTTYYSWIVAMLTLLAVLVPFTTSAALGSTIALAAMNLAAGMVILCLVPMAAVNARVNARR